MKKRRKGNWKREKITDIMMNLWRFKCKVFISVPTTHCSVIKLLKVSCWPLPQNKGLGCIVSVSQHPCGGGWRTHRWVMVLRTCVRVCVDFMLIRKICAFEPKQRKCVANEGICTDQIWSFTENIMYLKLMYKSASREQKCTGAKLESTFSLYFKILHVETLFSEIKKMFYYFISTCVFHLKKEYRSKWKKYIYWNCGSHSQLKVWGNVDWEGQVCVNYCCVFRCFVKALKLISILIEGRNGRKMIYWKRLVKKTKNTGV